MGWFDDFVDDVEGAVDDALNTLGDVVNAIGDAVKSGGKVLGTVVDDIGLGIKYVVNGVAYELGDLIGIDMRSLNEVERGVLRGVFAGSLPVDQILLTSIPGKDGRAFTVPGSMVTALSSIIPGIGPLVALGSLIDDLQDKYLINVGAAQYRRIMPSEYDNRYQERSGSLLVHESTHVWQGVNSGFSWWYVFNSLYNQIKCGSHAYDVDENHLQTWSTYGAEQQAHLVENWFSRGSSTTDSNYPFIRDNIRPGRPSATTKFPIAYKVATSALFQTANNKVVQQITPAAMARLHG